MFRHGLPSDPSVVLVTLLLIQAAASPDPGRWQQRVSYAIDASLDEPAGTLRGTQRLVYHNRSPDTLVTLSFHLYLNAFRPGSRWARADSAERRRRFNDLRDPDFGRNQVKNVRISGRPVAPIYPFAPDSTIVRFLLPAPLLPGDSLVAEMDWEARPSTVLRRQGRRGRAYDFAQWYPRVVVYDRLGWQEQPLYPAGEFYGEFGDFTVTLDLPEDQVVGATGVPVCGDPGWERAARAARPEGEAVAPIRYGRDRYPDVLAGLPPGACLPRGPGRKTIVWRAEEVHHFALAMRPDFRYEGGEWRGRLVHVLYQPGADADWGGGVALQRTITALEWLDSLFGPYPWPQITNLHRLEGGGTEFPMMMMNGSAGQGLILHELGHNYLMGVLANNEWREGWLDEGFSSFQTTWFFEEQLRRVGRLREAADLYRANEWRILEWDLDGRSEPVSLPAQHYRDFTTYGAMVYNRGELFFHQLRDVVGDDTMRLILRTYYDRFRLRHVSEADFRQVAEEVSGRDLSTFFAQWLHGTVLYDYAVGAVKAARAGGPDQPGRWVTRVEVVRKQQGIYPVEVEVRTRLDTATVRASGVPEREWVTVLTRGRPQEVLVDPRARAHDWNLINNRWRRGFLGLGIRGPRVERHLDRVVSTRQYRDRVALGLLPTVWYNEEGGVMVGVRRRGNYLGRFNQELGELSLATRRCCEDRSGWHWYARLQNPTWLRAPRTTTALEAFRLEGRHGAAVTVEHERLGHLAFGARTAIGGSVRWVATHDQAYLDPAEYDNAGTVEAETWVRSAERRGSWQVAGTLSAGLGVEYRNRGPGVTAPDRYDAQPYLRLHGQATAARPLDDRSELRLRLFGGWVKADDDPVRQRWFGVAGADPYQKLRNPFLRSRNALLTGDVHFHQPGGGNVRGLDPRLAATRILAGSVEADRALLRRPAAAIGREVRLAVFGDLAWTDGIFSTRTDSDIASDLGVGLRIGHRIGETSFVTRVDFPLMVSHPDRAPGARAGDAVFRFRWTLGLGAGF